MRNWFYRKLSQYGTDFIANWVNAELIFSQTESMRIDFPENSLQDQPRASS